ncbi:mandelate racemase/muconate lactonizing enzyme family protein [Paenibacillus koleovorans]|uniref:mandelate racemase/muconate lactonizing enzyme family protein n=1 Tax=Paenibacillus koleovorans TaxID=121608 RepID=UPI000FDB5CB7|nr:enolase C-terminal domain-like protein [Paenibacillus koleovorans]
MKIRSIDIYPLKIPFKASFGIARGKVGGTGMQRTVVLIKLTDTDGIVGWGEASPSHIWSSETLESVVTTLEAYYAPTLIGHPCSDIDGMIRNINRLVGPNYSIAHPIAKCGLDLAMHDLIGKRRGLTIGELWGYERTQEATLSWTISATNLQEAEQILLQGLEVGYRNFNIKLGISPAYDVELCRLVRRMVPDSYLWGDANGGYQYADIRRIVHLLEEAGLDLLEQPLPSNQMQLMRELRQVMSIPLGADEPLLAPRDLLEWAQQGLISAYVAKVSRSAGLFYSRIACEIAEHWPMPIVCSGLTETGLGLAANVHLACAFGVERPCAWNGPQFLADDILKVPHTIKEGRILKPNRPGLGVEVDEAKIKAFLHGNPIRVVQG